MSTGEVLGQANNSPFCFFGLGDQADMLACNVALSKLMLLLETILGVRLWVWTNLVISILDMVVISNNFNRSFKGSGVIWMYSHSLQ